MSGILYGVGVGPGDPELLTIKAIKIITESEVLAVAISDPGFEEVCYEEVGENSMKELLHSCTAYQIIAAAIPGTADKAKLYLPMPMIKDKERLKAVHDACATEVAGQLADGRSVAFITLGDPTIYSTCLYVHKRIKKMGYETVLVPGITSFCAAAAKIDSGLAENSQQLHVIPGSYEIEESLKLPGTKVLMKAGRKMPAVKEAIQKSGGNITMVENCGMEQEHIYLGVEDIPDDAGYYSLIIIKEEAQ